MDGLHRNIDVCALVVLAKNCSCCDNRKHQKYDEARGVFSDICLKQLDWPEAVWEAWISFENLYGDITEIEACSEKVLRAQYFNNERRAKVSSFPTSLVLLR
jgi:hypothetical protein